MGCVNSQSTYSSASTGGSLTDCDNSSAAQHHNKERDSTRSTRTTGSGSMSTENRFWKNIFKNRSNSHRSNSQSVEAFEEEVNEVHEKAEVPESAFRRRGSREEHKKHYHTKRQRSPRTKVELCPCEEKLAEKAIKREKTGEDLDLIYSALKNNIVVSLLDETEMSNLSDALEYYEVKPGDICCKEGNFGSYFFIIAKGLFEVREQERLVNTMRPGQAFGEIALINKCPRSATVTAKNDSALWGVRHTKFRSVLKSLSSKSYSENRCFLESVDIFKVLTETQKKKVCEVMQISMYAAGVIVVSQGESGNCLYFVKSGILRVSITEENGGEKTVRKLTNGAYFGERSLLYQEPRSATVTAETAAVCVSIGVRELELVFGVDDHQGASVTSMHALLFRSLMEISLRDANSRVFSAFTATKEAVSNLLKQAVIREFAIDTVIHEASDRPITPGTPTSPIPASDDELSKKRLAGVRFFIVLEGAVNIDGDDFGRGQIFGEQYVMDKSLKFNHTVTTLSKDGAKTCRLALFGAEALAFGDFENRIDYATKLQVLRNVTVFRALSDQQQDLLAQAFTALPIFDVGHEVITQNEFGNTFYIIKKGEVKAEKDGKILRTMGKNDYFGERALLYDEPRSASVTVTAAKTELWCIDKTVFLQIIQGPMLEHLEYRIRLQNTTMELEDLKSVRVVGRGTFGTVKLVTHKVTKTRYAMKCVRKQAVVELRQEDNIKMEREILGENDHPFIIHLVRTFKDDRFLYFLTELVTGGELYDAIRRLGILSEAHSQFYFASMGLAIDYLHERTIVYRDLKPENVLLDHQGYIKLIDFGCARKLGGEKSYTLVGTPHYMAPEVILGKGYSHSADIWSLGVCLYEFICGPLPFGNDADQQLAVFKDILTGKLAFPNYVTSRTAMDLMKRLLSRLPENRIGCSLAGFTEIRKCRYFQNFSWDKLQGRELTPPLVPQKESYAEDSEDNPPDDDNLAMPVTNVKWDEGF